MRANCIGNSFWKGRNKKIVKKLKEQGVSTIIDFFAKMLEKDMPPPPEPDEDELDEDELEEEVVEKTWEEIEEERILAEKDAKANTYIDMPSFMNEFEEFRRFKEPTTGRYYWVNIKTKEELWNCPVPGTVISVGDWIRALDHAYQRAYWYNKLTLERVWVLPAAQHSKARKYTESALALRRARGFPDPPKSVSGAGGPGRAAVWWVAPTENERFPNTRVSVNRYRLDTSEDPLNPEWEFKGTQVFQLDDCDDGVLPVQCVVDELKELTTYRFSVFYANSVGESIESEFSNQMQIVSPLPDGWMEYDAPDGRSFYANNKTKGVTWERPENDPFFIETELFMKFSRREIKKIKRCYAEMDWDQSKAIGEDEWKDVLVELGEQKLCLDDKKFKWLWKISAKDEFGEVNFRECVMMLDEWREVKLNHRGFCAKYMCCLCLKFRAFLNQPRIGAAGNMLSGDEGLKLGDWVKCHHPLVNRPYYHNSKTKETTWEMPDEIRFFINDKLNNDLRRRYDEKQMEEFQKEFQAMDLDGSGAVDEAELGMILENLGENITAERLKGLIKEIDKDGSGEVEFEEFVVMLDAVWRGKGSFGWGKVSDASGDEENKKKLEAMKDNLEEYQEQYEDAQLEEARRKGKQFPHGKHCYCGCRKPPGRVGAKKKKAGG